MSIFIRFATTILALGLLALPVSSKGYLATRAEKLPELVLGTDNTGYEISQKEYKLETGKAYRLKIRSTGAKEYAFEAPEFFNFIWLRKVEAGGIEIKATNVYELEFENEGEAEIFFVPIRPGKYKFRARGLEKQGVFGHFIVE